MFLCCQTRKLNPAKITAFTVLRMTCEWVYECHNHIYTGNSFQFQVTHSRGNIYAYNFMGTASIILKITIERFEIGTKFYIAIYHNVEGSHFKPKNVYAVKVRCHTPWSHGPLSWIPWKLAHASSISQSISFRRHSLRITLKYTTLVHMRSSYAWTMKSWQRSEWRLGFNSVL